MEKLELKKAVELPNDDCYSKLYEIMGSNGPIINNNCSIALTKIDSNGSVVRHKHHESEETYIFTKGSATMIINGTEIPVTVGDTVIIYPEDIHELHVGPDSNVEFYAVTIPPFNETDFIVC